MTKKKKILFILQLPPPVHGVSMMNQNVVENSLIKAQFDTRVVPIQFANTISDIGKISPKKIWAMGTFTLKLIGVMLKFRPHVVYFTLAPIGGAFYRDFLFSMIMKAMGGKMLFHLHGVGIRKASEESRFKRTLYRLAFKNSNIIVLSSLLKTDLIHVYQGTPYVLPNGIRRIPQSPGNDSPEIPVFLFLSNLIKSKGIEVFLEAIRTLYLKKISFRALIVGASGDISIDAVRNYVAEHGLTDNVQVLGQLFGEDKQRMLDQADIFVLPSRNEAFPLAILEAMQAGLAVIGGNVGAISEIIDAGKTGYVVNSSDASETTEKMEYLATHYTQAKEMGANGKEKFEQQYTLDQFGQNLLKVFQDVTR